MGLSWSQYKFGRRFFILFLVDLILIFCQFTLCLHFQEGKYDTNSDVQPFPKLQKFITEPYFKKRDSLLDSDFRSFISNKLPLDSCAILQDKLNFMPRLSVLKRYLIGEGSHRRLLSSIGLSIEPESVAELPRNLCKVISIERLPCGVFADPFELQHLLQRGGKLHFFPFFFK